MVSKEVSSYILKRIEEMREKQLSKKVAKFKKDNNFNICEERYFQTRFLIYREKLRKAAKKVGLDYQSDYITYSGSNWERDITYSGSNWERDRANLAKVILYMGKDVSNESLEKALKKIG